MLKYLRIFFAAVVTLIVASSLVHGDTTVQGVSARDAFSMNPGRIFEANVFCAGRNGHGISEQTFNAVVNASKSLGNVKDARYLRNSKIGYITVKGTGSELQRVSQLPGVVHVSLKNSNVSAN